MIDIFEKPGSHEARNIRSSLRLAGLILVWTISMVVADKAELYGWYSASWQRPGAVILNAVLGIVMILDFIRFLRELDELQRRIQFEALAFALGITVAGNFSYSLMTTLGYITDHEVSDMTVLTMVSYAAAVLIGQWRYR